MMKPSTITILDKNMAISIDALNDPVLKKKKARNMSIDLTLYQIIKMNYLRGHSQRLRKILVTYGSKKLMMSFEYLNVQERFIVVQIYL